MKSATTPPGYLKPQPAWPRVDAPRPLHAEELKGSTFTCIPGCGFCCTFPPEVSTRELALLRKRLPVRVTSDGERSHLALHNKCGACTLLERRECQAYDLRPAHCRYFPFHVHFAPEPEVYVNYTCRGVARDPAGDLTSAFAASVLAVARADEWAEHARQARDTYGEFERRARRAGAWGSVDAALRQADVSSLGTMRGILAAAARAGEPTDAEAVHAEAMAPFEARDVTKRPFHLAADLKWLTFERDGAALRVLEMDEKGALRPVGTLDGFEAWRDAPVDLGPILARLVERRAFAGSVYALVDDAEYEMSVEQATWARLAEVGADLAVRARVLHALGIPRERLVEETDRFHDSAFLDAPTIGGWL